MIRMRSGEKLDFSDVLLLPRVGEVDLRSRSEVNLEIQGRVPIIVANMDSIGNFKVAHHLKKHRMMVAILKDYSALDWFEAVDEYELDPALLIPTVGTRNIHQEIKRIEAIFSKFPTLPMVCLDVANGYLHVVPEAIKAFKKAIPELKVCAGNIVTEDGVRHLAEAGVDVVKVGIGSGGVCLTRKMTGIGFPQFSAVSELAEVARECRVQLISDGGVVDPGDFVKAFAAGADFVMAGSVFAGHEETGIHFHGMSSDRSREERSEGIADYRASEGREVVLKSKGSLDHTVRGILGGIRSACTYLGVQHLEELKYEGIHAIQVRRQLNRIQGVDSEGRG